MFVDLVGSTALASRLDREEMREVLRAYQNMVTGEIARVDGWQLGTGDTCWRER
jgi:class 3 adenylate cyclase